MKKVTKLISLMLVMAMLTGCGNKAAAPNSAADNTEEYPEVREGIVLCDQLGREVVLEKPAETIVSAYYIATTTLIALGAENQLVGVEMKAEEREIYKLAAPQLLELPAMGNKKNFNLEECIKLNPDLVVLPIGLKDYIAQLEEVGIQVIVVKPETMSDFLGSVKLLGDATDHVAKADELIAYYRSMREVIEEKLVEVQEPKRVYIADGEDVLKSATAKMFQNEVVTSAKGEPVFADLEENGWTTISAEKLLMYNPDYIFAGHRSEDNVNSFVKEDAYASLKAVKEGNVYLLPCDIETWDTPSPSSILGIYWMSSVLYPESITMDEVRKEAISFYKQFFDIEVSTEQLGI